MLISLFSWNRQTLNRNINNLNISCNIHTYQENHVKNINNCYKSLWFKLIYLLREGEETREQEREQQTKEKKRKGEERRGTRWISCPGPWQRMDGGLRQRQRWSDLRSRRGESSRPTAAKNAGQVASRVEAFSFSLCFFVDLLSEPARIDSETRVGCFSRVEPSFQVTRFSDVSLTWAIHRANLRSISRL